MEEDWNMLGADCVVISCCCQCLMLQILVSVLIKVPYKIVRRTRRFVKRKFCGKKRSDDSEMGSYKDVLVRIHEKSIRFEAEMMMEVLRDDDSRHNCGDCTMDEVEKVMEEFYEKGELAFGIWGRRTWGVPTPTIVTNGDINDHDSFVRYQIIDFVDSLDYA